MTQTRMERTLALCRENNWLADKVERWIPQAEKRRDLFGIIDVIVLDGQPGVLGVQVCGDDVAPHRRKIAESPCAGAWLASGARLEIWAWRRHKRRLKSGGYSKLWQYDLTREEIRCEDLVPSSPS